MTEYAALSKTPHALADGLMLVFQHPVKILLINTTCWRILLTPINMLCIIFQRCR